MKIQETLRVHMVDRSDRTVPVLENAQNLSQNTKKDDVLEFNFLFEQPNNFLLTASVKNFNLKK